MNPKYEKGQRVLFRFHGEEKIGLVETIDSFFGHADIQYDAYVDSEPCLYKHLSESDILGVVR